MNLSQAEIRRNRDLMKAFVRALRIHRKGTGWRINEFVLFRELEGWLFESWLVVPVLPGGYGWQFRVKPMGVDPILWRVVGHPEWNDQPLSWRISGSACQPLVVAEAFPPLSQDADVDAAAAIAWSNEQVATFLQDASLERFIKMLDETEKPSNGHVITRIAAHILAGDQAAALSLAEAAAAKGEHGGQFFIGHGGPSTFIEGALAWLKDCRTPPH